MINEQSTPVSVVGDRSSLFVIDHCFQERKHFGVKRFFDAVISGTLLVFLSPLLVLLLLAVGILSGGSPIFVQERIGRHGKLFKLRKFRSMRVDAPSRPTHTVHFNYTTFVGKVLRKTSCDELPQLWNVLIGEMSLVGPRPCLPMQTDLIEARREAGVLAVRPGITGLSQSRGIDMSDVGGLVASDKEYVMNQSPTRDLKICINTVIYIFKKFL